MLNVVTGWLEASVVGEPALPLVQFKFVVYCDRLLTLPAAIVSLTVIATPEDMVATAAPNGPLPAPVEVTEARVAPLLVARAP